MNNKLDFLIVKKLILKELINEMCNKGVINFVNVSNIIQKLEKDISKMKNLQENNIDMKNIIVKILV